MPGPGGKGRFRCQPTRPLGEGKTGLGVGGGVCQQGSGSPGTHPASTQAQLVPTTLSAEPLPWSSPLPRAAPGRGQVRVPPWPEAAPCQTGGGSGAQGGREVEWAQDQSLNPSDPLLSSQSQSQRTTSRSWLISQQLLLPELKGLHTLSGPGVSGQRGGRREAPPTPHPVVK